MARKTRKNRRTRRKNRRGRGKLAKLPHGMPNSYRCTLKGTYNTQGTSLHSLTAGIYQLSIINSANAPCAALSIGLKGLNQLLGSTQGTAPYNQYRVNGIKAKVGVIGGIGTATLLQVVAVPYQSWNNYGSFAWATKVDDYKGGRKTTVYDCNHDNKLRSLSMRNTLKTSALLTNGDESYVAISGSSPTGIWGLQYMIRGDSSADTASFHLFVDVEYDITFFSVNMFVATI